MPPKKSGSRPRSQPREEPKKKKEESDSDDMDLDSDPEDSPPEDSGDMDVDDDDSPRKKGGADGGFRLREELEGVDLEGLDEFDTHFGIEDVVVGAEGAAVKEGHEEGRNDAVQDDVNRLQELIREAQEEVPFTMAQVKPTKPKAKPKDDLELEKDDMDKAFSYLFQNADDPNMGYQLWSFDRLMNMWKVRTDDVAVAAARQETYNTRIIGMTLESWRTMQEEQRERQRAERRAPRVEREPGVPREAKVRRDDAGVAAPRANITQVPSRPKKQKDKEDGAIPDNFITAMERSTYGRTMDQFLRDAEVVMDADEEFNDLSLQSHRDELYNVRELKRIKIDELKKIPTGMKTVGDFDGDYEAYYDSEEFCQYCADVQQTFASVCFDQLVAKYGLEITEEDGAEEYELGASGTAMNNTATNQPTTLNHDNQEADDEDYGYL